MKSILWIFLLILNFAFQLHGEESSLVTKSASIPDYYQSVNVIDGEFVESKVDLTLGGPYPFDIKRWSGKTDAIKTLSHGWVILPVDLFVGEKNPPKEFKHSTHKLKYDYDKSNSLQSIQTQSLDGKATFNGFKILANNDSKLEIESLTGQKLLYEFQKDNDKRKLLTKVKIPGQPTVNYTYQPHPSEKRSVIASRQEPLGRSLQIEYYSTKDFNNGKVKALKSPKDAGGGLVTIASFNYKPGETEVYDANHHKTVYKYSNDKQLIAIESQHPDGNASAQYRVHRFYWDHDKIVSKTIEDGQKKVYLCETFNYDSKGRLQKETLWGNLSGNSQDSFSVNSKGQPQGNVESYSTSYNYNDEGFPTTIKEDNGKETKYGYHSSLKILESRLTYFGNKIIQREFFEYDSQGRLAKTFVDDGSSTNKNELKDATERKITEVKTYSSYPNEGLPATVDDYIVDAASGTQTWLGCTRVNYTADGLPLTQEIYDGGGLLREKTNFEYDAEGRLKSKTDLEGVQTTYTYDELGNPLRRTSSNDKLDTNFQYDIGNRLIRQEELTTEGKLRGITYRYDEVGNKIAATDSCGNTTDYAYDALSRLVETTAPAVLDAEGHATRYKTHHEYDLFDRIVKTVDPDGNALETRFNARGKPIEVRYPDGTAEKTVYNLDSSVRESTNRLGFVTRFEYDGYGHPLVETTYTPSGQLAKVSRALYKGFRLLSVNGPNGKKIVYTYDKAGHVQTEADGLKKAEYEYDSYGQISVKKEWYGSGNDDYRVTRTERDDYYHVNKIYIEDSQGNILIERKQEEDDKPNNTFAEVDTKVTNELGQLVWQNTILDQNGLAMETIQDALGRTEKVIKKDPYGQIISEIQYRYDASGNTCKEIHTAIAPNQPETSFVISKRWGQDRKLLELVEGEGSTHQKVTSYQYDNGHLSAIHKPDGTTIHHEYNVLGQLTSIKASDRSFEYAYAYDSTGNIVEAQDLLTGTKTFREFDTEGNLTSETLATGLKSGWAYDRLGRLTQTTLPDNTSVVYNYNAALLQTIERHQKTKVLTHRYSYEGTYGRIAASDLMGNAGKVVFDYNADGLPQSLQSPYWSQNLEFNGRDKLGRMTQTLIKDPLGEIQYHFQYDPLSRLTEEKGHVTNSFTYDSTDNRLTENEKALTHNPLNQLMENGKSSFEYDINGNMIAERPQGMSQRCFAYDALNRLTCVLLSDTERYRYVYDPFNRRIAKAHEEWNANEQKWKTLTEEHYLYYGDQEIGAADSQGTMTQLRVLGVGLGAEIGAAVLMELNGHNYVPIHDIQGSVRCLVDIESKQAVEFYRYSAFGQTTIYDKTHNQVAESVIGNAWLYSSKRLDAESGFYFYGKRFYSPDLGQWVSPDPLGFADGPNLYAFVHQNPLNAIDLYGLFSFSDLWNKIKSFFINCFQKIKSFFQMIGNGIKTYLNPKTVGEFFKFLFYEALAKGYALIRGDNYFQSGSGVYGTKEVNDKVRVTFINGVNTRPNFFERNLEEVSSTHGGVKVHYVYSATRGLLLDLVRAAKIKFGGFTSQEAYLLADTWRQMIAEMGGVNGGGTIVHYAHSIGAGDTEKALALMSQEELAMIQITTFGSPVLIDDDRSGATVVNYVNVRDGISLLDPARFFKALFKGERGIIFIGSMNGFPFIDHLFSCPVYYHIVETLGKYFMQIYGA